MLTGKIWKSRIGCLGLDLAVFLYPGADPEETILNAFKVFDPEGKGVLRKD